MRVQFTTIVKIIIENAPSGEELRGMDIMATLLLVAKLITRINDPSAYRIRVKFCALCDSYLDQSESFSVRKDGTLRIGIADYVVEWAQDPSNVSTLRLEYNLLLINIPV